jgi:hypothetical protein
MQQPELALDQAANGKLGGTMPLSEFSSKYLRLK